MNLGNNLFHARKNADSHRKVSHKSWASADRRSQNGKRMKPFRTSVSQKMTLLYNISLDELIDFDIDVREIQEVIGKTSEKNGRKNQLDKCMRGEKISYPAQLSG